MNKAFIVTTGDYMTGVGANDTLPSNSQGMGRVNLYGAFNGTTPALEDQPQVLPSTGQTFTSNGSISDSAAPFRVALVWTDAPGATSGAPYVNDLDLEVTVGGTTYRGNVFAGAFSTSGGSADIRNNTESVFLPAGTNGAFSVTVRASSIAGDGVPGNGDSTDQDFALVITNAGPSGPVLPTANFSASPTTGVAPMSVNFADLSSASVTAWAWAFGDGATSAQQNPSHSYVNPGSYSVSLTVTDAVGNGSITKANFITTSAPPVPGISDGSFEGQTAGGAPSTPWAIEFGTGHVVNPAGGTSSDNAMPSDGSQWAEISASSTNAGTPPSNPGGLTNPPSGGAGVTQDFSYGAGQTTLVFDAAFMRNEGANQGTYNDWMSVDITDGSTWQNLYYADTFTAAPSTSAKNGFAMTAVTSVSVDLTTLFPGSNTGTNFTVTAVVANAADGVQASAGYVDNFALTGVAQPPVASFTGTPLSGTSPLNVGFSDSSSGSVASYAWTFGDGGTSTAQNPSHTYVGAGNYSVTLTVSGPGGSDLLTRANYISVGAAPVPPTASFSANPTSGVAPLPVNFTDLSSGDVTSWSWTFGDGGTSASQNPSHAYTAAGTYTVSLTASGPGGSDTSTSVNLVTVTAPPTSGKLYYMSFLSTTTVPGVGTARDEDIVSYDAATGTWTMHFDGSDVGIGGTDINAFTIRADGSILMSFNSTSTSVPGLTGGPNGLAVEDSDVVLFTPSQLGSSTSGSFSFYFDGSDVGLTSNGEDIDGIHENADGSLSISTLGANSASGLAKGKDEDVITISLTSTGSNTAGSWSFTFDGSDVGFGTSSSEDLSAISFDGGDLLFSTQGNFSASGASGADEDAGRFSGNFGTATSGSVVLELDLSTLGIDTSEDIDGICYR
jgi:PKD repeat protein